MFAEPVPVGPCALAEGLVWRVNIPGFFALGAAHLAVQMIIGGLVADDKGFIHFSATRLDVDIHVVPVVVVA